MTTRTVSAVKLAATKAAAQIIIPPDDVIITQTRDITPDIAKQWMELNGVNRPISKVRVLRFVTIILAGRWRHTHQGVAFNHAGQLMDGQHRLLAIEQANAESPMRMQVSFGVEDFAAIDTGRPRSAGDILGIAGVSNGRNVAAAIRLMHPYYMGSARPWATTRNILDAESIMDLGLLHHEEIIAQQSYTKRINRRLEYMSNAATTAGLTIAARWAQANGFVEEFEEWREGLATGIDLGKDGRLALASWASKSSRMFHSGMRSELLTMLLLRAFNAYLNGEELTRMQVNSPGTHLYRLPGDSGPAARAAWIGADATDVEGEGQ